MNCFSTRNLRYKVQPKETMRRWFSWSFIDITMSYKFTPNSSKIG